MAVALSEEPRSNGTCARPLEGRQEPCGHELHLRHARKMTPRKLDDFHPSCLDRDENRWGADVRSAVARLEARMHALEGQSLRSDRRASELAGLAQALTEEQRALLIRLDRLEDLKRRDAVQVPEDRLGRLEQEHRTLALELRLTVSVAEEAQQKQQQRIRSVEESLATRIRKLERAGGEPDLDGGSSAGRNWPEASPWRTDEAKEASRLCDTLEAKVGGLTASVEKLQRQMAEASAQSQRSQSVSPSRLTFLQAARSPEEVEPLALKVDHLENFCCELRETLEDRFKLALEDLQRQVPDLLQKFQRQVEDGADRAEKLHELEVRVEMSNQRITTQEERLQSCSERVEKSVSLPQLRTLCREELQKRLLEEDLLGTASAILQQQEALSEVQLQMHRLVDRLQLMGLRQTQAATL
ncbi:unnamed protein product [Durusdinium trenchii]|uniref:Uncharacterized protein n=1 Tax=Durusdinium trenchii TaxID=1381693 RepID=A0ABP0IKF6_9DINO